VIPAIQLIQTFRQSTLEGTPFSISQSVDMLKNKLASPKSANIHISDLRFQLSSSKIIFSMKLARHESIQILNNNSITFNVLDIDEYPEDKSPTSKDKKKKISKPWLDVRFSSKNELTDRQTNVGTYFSVTHH
jgi:hypothetical protein